MGGRANCRAFAELFDSLRILSSTFLSYKTIFWELSSEMIDVFQQLCGHINSSRSFMQKQFIIYRLMYLNSD
jgi:hypothetical protein